MAAIGQRITETGRPTPEQQAEMERLQGRMALGSRLTAGLLVISAGAMAIARYL
jgi:hypothetical protein